MALPNSTKQLYERLIAARNQSKTANPSVIADLVASKSFQDTHCCSHPVYLEQITVMKATLPDVVIDDTVGEHLYGCFQPELAVEIACTPGCADGGLYNPDLTPCDLASYEKKDEFRKLNDIVSDEAHLFIATGNEFTVDDRRVLRGQGIKVVTTYNQDGNTINYILGETINIEREQPVPTPGAPPINTTDGTWVWLIIVAVLVILFIVLLWTRY